MSLRLAIAAAAAALTASSASAGLLINVSPGSSPYAGPGFTPHALFEFETSTPRWNRAIFTGSTPGVRAQPFGSTGGYASVGPTDGSPGVFDLSDLGSIEKISFIWGSVDSYNTLQLLGAGDSILFTIVGNQIVDPANGDQSDPTTNPLVTLQLTGAHIGTVTALRFSSSQNAFEFDNLAIGVPEPASWAMMIGGFGLVGAAARRRKLRVIFA